MVSLISKLSVRDKLTMSYSKIFGLIWKFFGYCMHGGVVVGGRRDGGWKWKEGGGALLGWMVACGRRRKKKNKGEMLEKAGNKGGFSLSRLLFSLFLLLDCTHTPKRWLSRKKRLGVEMSRRTKSRSKKGVSVHVAIKGILESKWLVREAE